MRFQVIATNQRRLGRSQPGKLASPPLLLMPKSGVMLQQKAEADALHLSQSPKERGYAATTKRQGGDTLRSLNPLKSGVMLQQEMAGKIKKKAEQFAQLTGLMLGARQRIEKQMKAAHQTDDLPELERLIAVAKVEILKPLSSAV